jgi:hypothetical protein
MVMHIKDGFYLWLGILESALLKLYDYKARQAFEDMDLKVGYSLLMIKTKLSSKKAR